MKLDINKIFLLFICTLTLLFICGTICFHLGSKGSSVTSSSNPTDVTSEKQASKNNLILYAQIDHEYGMQEFSVLNREDTVTIYNLYDVHIALPEGLLHLEDALSCGLITPEQIVSWAKQDAMENNCKELFFSENGLSHYIYRYSQLELCVYDDVFEAPNGEQYQIRDLTIRDCGETKSGVSLSIPDENGELQMLDREEWGLSFRVERISDSTLSLFCNQSGGQQIGQLEIVDFLIYQISPEKLIYESYQETPIQANGETQVLLDCSNYINKLTGGDYKLRLIIRDKYDATQVHPLMKNFEDSQYHFIDFTLP